MTKTILMLLALLLGTSPVWSQEEAKDADSKITDVTVYLQGAQVTRKASVLLERGENIIAFRGLATKVLKSSIQASAPSSVLINSVTQETNFLTPKELTPRQKEIDDSLQTTKANIEEINIQLETVTTERGMILKNQSLAGNETGVNVSELQQAAVFFRERLTELAGMERKLKLKNEKLKAQQNRLTRQLQALNARKNRPSNDILVKLTAKSTVKIEMAISYLVSNASWQPSYDLRATDTNSPVGLTYRGEVFQNTGNDWTDVKLTLSSTNPNLSGTKPELAQWNLYLQEPYAYGLKGRADRARERSQGYYSSAPEIAEEEPMDMSGAYTGMTLADFTTVREGITSAEFEIKIPQRIPSDAQYHQVSIRQEELPAIYQHSAVPKVDPTAFLLARITNWEQLDLLPGKVNIFFEGTYIAESFIDPNYTQDTLDMSLGRDPKVIIERKQLKDFNKVRTLGVNRERTFAYEISVRNAKSSPVSLVLYDQIPVSQDEDITIKVEEQSEGSIDEDTGKVTWKLDLAPAETKTLKLIFSVKHPKKKTVPGI